MTTPILDFLRRYAQADNTARLHMPGHKGHAYLGAEPLDVTEIEGADNLYYPSGIIAQSQANAATIFGAAHTFYACGGTSQCVCATMWMLTRYAAQTGKAPLVLAARNVHQCFVSALVQTGLDVDWLLPVDRTDLSCPITPEALQSHLRAMPILPVAVYVTSPNYLGETQPIAQLADVCHQFGVLLVVDNAHGAYLRFVPSDSHPLSLGADICCDSAHKTLGVLTGGAYLHLAATTPAFFAENASSALLLAGSTSPSYLVLASLDAANAALGGRDYRQRLSLTVQAVQQAKRDLAEYGWQCLGDEPLKIALYTASFGWRGVEVAKQLRMQDVECEMADEQYLVLMLSADTPPEHLQRALRVLLCLPRQEALPVHAEVPLCLPQQAMSPRAAYVSPRATLPIAQCQDRILAYLPVRCPPAVPAAIAGERLSAPIVAYLQAQDYTQLDVVQENVCR